MPTVVRPRSITTRSATPHLPSTLLLFLILFRSSSLVFSSSSSKFPIADLEASLAAAAAQTTVVAVQSVSAPISSDSNNDNDSNVSQDNIIINNNEDCVVLLSRTPFLTGGGGERHSNLTRSSTLLTPNDNNNNDERTNHQYRNDNNDETERLIPVVTRGDITTIQYTSNDDSTTQPIIIRPTTTTTKTTNNRNLYILQPSSGLTLAATGFAPDVSHLVRYLAESVSTHEYIYGTGGSGGDDGGPNVHQLVRNDLASKLREAAFVGGKRPFGVDLMVVGNNGRLTSQQQQRRRQEGYHGSMALYTVDPTGNWKHWGGGATCIGKGAVMVRKELYRALYGDDGNGREGESSTDGDGKRSRRPNTWVQALEVAIDASFRVFDSEDSSNRNNNCNNKNKNDGNGANSDAVAEYDAIVLFGNDGNHRPSRCAVVDRRFVLELYRKCVEKNKNNKKQ